MRDRHYCPVCGGVALLGVGGEAACMCGWRGGIENCRVEQRPPALPQYVRVAEDKVAGFMSKGSGA